MNKKVMIRASENGKLFLRSIDAKDLENLRKWKNEHRKSFFFQYIITPEQQKIWFSNYLKDRDNCMFITEYDGADIGCIGFKIKNKTADIYNVILADKVHRRKGLMSLSVNALGRYIADLYLKSITVKVLNSNVEGLNFYMKNGFLYEKKNNKYTLLRQRLGGSI